LAIATRKGLQLGVRGEAGLGASGLGQGEQRSSNKKLTTEKHRYSSERKRKGGVGAAGGWGGGATCHPAQKWSQESKGKLQRTRIPRKVRRVVTRFRQHPQKKKYGPEARL